MLWKHQNSTNIGGIGSSSSSSSSSSRTSSSSSSNGSSSGSSNSSIAVSNSTTRTINGAGLTAGNLIGRGGGASDALHIRYAGRDYETIKAVYKEPKSHNGFEGEPPRFVQIYVPTLDPPLIHTTPTLNPPLVHPTPSLNSHFLTLTHPDCAIYGQSV